MPKNLWGDLSEIQVTRTPKALLQEQAALLTEATQGLLVGNVVEDVRGDQFESRLEVLVPNINNYILNLLTVRHGIELYPAVINPYGSARECNTEEELEREIGAILSSPGTKRNLSILLSQAK